MISSAQSFFVEIFDKAVQKNITDVFNVDLQSKYTAAVYTPYENITCIK